MVSSGAVAAALVVLNVYALSLARALVDWFSSAEYGELQLVQEAYKGIVN